MAVLGHRLGPKSQERVCWANGHVYSWYVGPGITAGGEQRPLHRTGRDVTVTTLPKTTLRDVEHVLARLWQEN